MADWNLASVWESISDTIADRPALIQGDRNRSWREFDDRASRLATGLHISPGAKVAFYLYNSNEYTEALFATTKARGVHVNVNYRYTEDELEYILENSDAEVLIFHGVLADQVAKIRSRATRVHTFIQVDDGSPNLSGAVRYEDVIADNEPQERLERSGDDQWFLYTGGTTGMPKGVMWRQEDLFGSLAPAVYPIYGQALPENSASAGKVAAQVVESGRAPVHLPASPLMHGTGAMTSMQTLFLGGTIVTLENRHFDPDELWTVVARERVTQMAIVGDAFCAPMVRALDEAQARNEPFDTSSLALVVSSGVIWSAPVKAGLMAHQPVICLDSLGSSEGVGFASNITAPGSESTTAKFSIGALTKVMTEDGEEVLAGSGQRGMLALGGHIPLGYYKDPEKSAGTFREFNGQRYSIPGDWATVETDGTITLLGRGSVCINSGGEKIYPEEVEEAVKMIASVNDCLVVGVPDERFGESVAAVIAANEENAVTLDAVAEATSHLARFKTPRHLVIVKEIPRGPNGKADYRWAKTTARNKLGLDS
ncbi:unannotated protein [freshwater metagenome]|uniref:Unannotated protein n=2 Tax=freshwater metagenome TaxID=449393 RepID=A0A6J7RK58_9ZZZZ|nr:AMP-binding protein [Actinomycetota bacterium]MSV94452.1 AMP-binding protein [Actinomycetota bacterium]MSY44680.1 AMP-binding protein [Actinomycetota bacterium]